MKKIYLYTINVLLATLFFGSCSGDYDSFLDPVKYTGSPSSVSNITSEALPGQILLRWDVPTDSNYYFVRVKYYDHLKKQDVTKILSVYTDSLLISGTRAKYGDYDFTFQSFNAKNEGGEIKSIKARSGVAPIQETIETIKLNLTVDQLSSNAADSEEGQLSHLVDNNVATFFHTDWHGVVPPPHYLDVHLAEPISDFIVYFQNRQWSQACAKTVDIMISNDGDEWQTLTTINAGLPTGGAAEYTSQIFRAPISFTYLRWYVRETSDGTVYWNMAEFGLYKVIISTYDPEAGNN